MRISYHGSINLQKQHRIYAAISWILAVLFCVVFSVLLIRKHDTFNTRVYDLARFDQAIWNTLQGRFLFSTILNRSILSNHFSPYMALLSPLFLIWSDVRALFVVQAAGVAVAGLFLHKILRHHESVRLQYPAVPLLFLVSFYLNPMVHEVTLYEFRRIVLAVPYLSLALYALYVRKRWLMAFGLGMALLCKEDVGFIVAMVGVFLVLFQRDWKWGGALVALGATWVIVVSLWVIPLFAPAGDAPGAYPQLYYFDYLGDSYSEILRALLRDPLILARQLWDRERLFALWRLFAPLGIALPFLAPEWVLICLPTLGYLLLSNEHVLYRLEKWHPASILPVLFAAVAVGWVRLVERARSGGAQKNKRWNAPQWAIAALMTATIAGFAVYSSAPLGGMNDAALYRVTEHHRRALEIVAAVPSDARVAAQVRYVPHLAHREHIYHYPWIVIGLENVDYVLVDRQSNPYPFLPDELNREIDNLVADPAYTIELESDGIYLLRHGGDLAPFIPVDRVADGTMRLDRVDMAVSDDLGILRAASRERVELRPDQEVRISLYWEALADPNAERTVSVRLMDAKGVRVAQHDSMPGGGNKPTSWWKEGWKIRDVHHLQLAPTVHAGMGSLEVVVYDSHSSEIVPFAAPNGGAIESLRLSSVLLSSPQ